MKSFLEEYGFTILAAIVVILIIAMCTPIGNLIKEQVLGVVNSFAAKTEGKLAAIDADAPVKVTLKQTATAKFHMVAESDSNNDTYTVQYRVKDQNGNWSTWNTFGEALTEPTGASAKKDHNHDADLDINFYDSDKKLLQNGNQVQVRVTDTGADDKVYYESNIVTYTGDSGAPETNSGVNKLTVVE